MSKSRLRYNCLSGSARAKVERIVNTLRRHKLPVEPRTGKGVFRAFCLITGKVAK